MLARPFTAQPEAQANSKAGAFGWAVNRSAQDATQFINRDRLGLNVSACL
jgi:hypothetical protein